MVRRYDFHLHTLRSPDAPRDAGGTVDDLCREALARPLAGIAITDHYEVTEPGAPPCELDDFCFPPEVVRQDVARARERYGDRLQIFAGIELGSPAYDPARARQVLAAGDFDFVLVSCHRTRDIVDFYHYDYENRTPDALRRKWEQYLAELYEGLETTPADAAAHLTYPCRYYLEHGKLDALGLERRWRDDFADVLKLLIRRGIALEVNTSGLRGRLGTTMPDDRVLRLYRDLGGRRITVGSDAHRRADLGAGIPETYARLCALGFRSVQIFERRNPIDVPLSD